VWRQLAVKYEVCIEYSLSMGLPALVAGVGGPPAALALVGLLLAAMKSVVS